MYEHSLEIIYNLVILKVFNEKNLDTHLDKFHYYMGF